MNSFLRWLIGPKIPEGSVGVITARESNYLRLNGQVKVPPQWIEPLREGEDGIIGPVREGEFRPHYRNAIERMRAEEFKRDFVNQLEEVLS